MVATAGSGGAAIGLENADSARITIGVEEEFFLVDPETRDIVSEPDPGVFEACKMKAGPHRVVPEFMSAQIETNTRVCASVAELREALRETRMAVVDAAAEYGMAAMAASTHPFAAWTAQTVTPRERYRRFAVRFQDALRRFLVGGMHVHVGFGNADERIRVMTAMRRYLPLFNALSGSSPFSDGRETGFKSWRLSVLGGMPRTGVPGPMHSQADFEQLLDEYRYMEFLSDGSELWWDIRPSHAYPTVELRVCDVCTRMEDALSLAALYAAVVRWLLRLDREGAMPMEPHTEIIAENRWLAQRYGVLAFLGVEGGGQADIEDLVRGLIESVADDAAALGCEDEVRRCLSIVREGTGADRQIDLFRLRRLEGDSVEDAMRAVVDLVLEETRADVGREI